MLGKFETKAHILAIRQQALCCRPLILYQKNQHHIRPLIRSRK